MKKILFLAVLAQPILLLVFFIYAILPLYFGENVMIKTSGYDPRDLFRGNYVDLRYDFNSFKYEKYEKVLTDVYAVLDRGDDGIYKTSKIVTNRPKSGVYIKGKNYEYTQKFGIEKYFLPEDKALELEKKLRTDENLTAIAHLKILNGDARIVDVELILNFDENATQKRR